MFIGMGMPIPDLSNLPGVSRPGAGPSGPSVDQIANQFSFEFDGAQDTRFDTGISTVGIDFSFSCWIYHSGTFQGNYIRPVYHSLLTSNLQLGGFQLYHGTGTTLQMYDGLVGGSMIAVNNWHHLAGVWDNTSKVMEYYLNGSLDLTRNFASYVLISRNLEIGDISSGYSSTNYRSWDGKIDEYAFWSGVKLDDKSIKAIYDATTSGMTADLSTLSTGAPTAWYRMGD